MEYMFINSCRGFSGVYKIIMKPKIGLNPSPVNTKKSEPELRLKLSPVNTNFSNMKSRLSCK